jgi:hypothetical protein
MQSAALALLLAVGAIASALLWPALFATAFRQLLRAWPDARNAFVGRGSWISFSRRFGIGYAIVALVLAFGWVVIGAHLVPNSPIGALLLFGPSFLLLIVGVCLGALVVSRWVVDN